LVIAGINKDNVTELEVVSFQNRTDTGLWRGGAETVIGIVSGSGGVDVVHG